MLVTALHWLLTSVAIEDQTASRDGWPGNRIECVVLLHGLARSPRSMEKMANGLRAAGFKTVNHGYDSRRHPIEDLSGVAIPAALAACDKLGASRIHFTTHSMGGILVRHYLSGHQIRNLGRVVMLGPPNQGSEVVDALVGKPGFEFVNGPAGAQLGTTEGSLPLTLGAAEFEVGIIAGNQSINLINSMIIPDQDDGKVSVNRARLEGMTDFLVVPNTHPFIMKDETVIRQTILFLRHGCFDHGQARPEGAPCPPDATVAKESPNNP